MTDYTPLLKALTMPDSFSGEPRIIRGNLRLPTDPKRTLNDMQSAIQTLHSQSMAGRKTG